MSKTRATARRPPGRRAVHVCAGRALDTTRDHATLLAARGVEEGELHPLSGSAY